MQKIPVEFREKMLQKYAAPTHQEINEIVKNNTKNDKVNKLRKKSYKTCA